jgi:hypothetical protein
MVRTTRRYLVDNLVILRNQGLIYTQVSALINLISADRSTLIDSFYQR